MNEFMSKSFGSQKKKNLLFDIHSFKKKKKCFANVRMFDIA